MSLQIYKNGRLAISPSFVPLCLVQVVDLGVGAQLFQTVVPSNRKFIAFHRGLGFTDKVYWAQIVSNGYWALNFPTGNHKQTGTRIYIFSDFQVNIPEWGFYVYNNGVLVWHSNCLPLKMASVATQVSNNPNPLAITSAITGCYQIGTGPDEGFYGWYICAAGYSPPGLENQGNWCTKRGILSQRRYTTPPDDPNYPGNYSTVAPAAYIETHIYDQYYQAALGY